MGDRRYRREGRRADDRGDHRSPAAASASRRRASSFPVAAARILTELSSEFGVPFERGPDELKDLPAFLRQARQRHVDLSRHDMRIFAEIVDASALVGRCDRRARAGDARLPAPTSSTSAVCRTRRFRISKTAVRALQGRGYARQRRLRRTRRNYGAARRPAPISC